MPECSWTAEMSPLLIWQFSFSPFQSVETLVKTRVPGPCYLKTLFLITDFSGRILFQINWIICNLLIFDGHSACRESASTARAFARLHRACLPPSGADSRRGPWR